MRGIGFTFYTESYRDSGLGGSWVVISEVMSGKALDVTDFQGLIALQLPQLPNYSQVGY